jgi:hypothetical protein
LFFVAAAISPMAPFPDRTTLPSPMLHTVSLFWWCDVLTIPSLQLYSQHTSINRVSVYSNSPSFASTTSSEVANGMAEIKELAQGLDRLKDKRLEQQRFVQSAEKIDHLSKLALGAKLQRAIDRRFSKQDAVMREKKPRQPSHCPIVIDEKAVLAERQLSAA